VEFAIPPVFKSSVEAKGGGRFFSGLFRRFRGALTLKGTLRLCVVPAVCTVTATLLCLDLYVLTRSALGGFRIVFTFPNISETEGFERTDVAKGCATNSPRKTYVRRLLCVLL